VTEQQSAGAAVTVSSRPEAEIRGQLRESLRGLLGECFPDYPDRSYFKLPPHFRYVVMSGDTVQAQAGVEFRVIRVGEHVLRTLGIVDLCVADRCRGQGLAGRLLAEVTAYAAACEMDFVILFADDDRLYLRDGWVRVGNPLSWVKIHEHATLGVARAVTPHAMMVKPVGPRPWPAGEVDLLGHVF
jgi:GNAT superfamily N-acetyltransferase